MSKPEIKTLYRCGKCCEVHDDEDVARECCMPEIIEVYACPICGLIHDEEEDAGKCCGFDIARCPSCHREYGAGHINYSAIAIAGHCNTCNPFFTVYQKIAIEDLCWQETGRAERLNA